MADDISGGPWDVSDNYGNKALASLIAQELGIKQLPGRPCYIVSAWNSDTYTFIIPKLNNDEYICIPFLLEYTAEGIGKVVEHVKSKYQSLKIKEEIKDWINE